MTSPEASIGLGKAQRSL